jgi:N-acetylglucosaminyldiphosphoundecaprenol N-acetyl-beta-D-mannosaminyltransferase
MIKKYKTVKVLGAKFTCCQFEDILAAMATGVDNGCQGYISITNSESVYHATKNVSHLRYINDSDFSCCDGIAVVLSGKILGHKIPRLHGPDLMIRCCEYGIAKRWRHFFYGSKNEVLELLRKQFVQEFPDIIIAGQYSPPFRPLTAVEDEAVIRKISSSKPDILWVGLGLLKQEQWISDHFNKIKVPWMIGVGAAFDFHAGTIKRAPTFLRKLGLEWLYRLTFEPRMLVRNLYSLSIFLPVVKEFLKKFSLYEK